jgi:hypothetical protein
MVTIAPAVAAATQDRAANNRKYAAPMSGHARLTNA